MSLAQTQAEWARRFTLAHARREGDPQADEIARFAATLIAKRRLDVEKWLPATAAALGPAFAPRLRATLAEPPPGARADALAFAARLRGSAEPAWIGELADYEAQFVRAWGPGAFFAVRLYRWPLPRLAQGLAEPSPAVTLAGWARRPGGRLWHRWRIWR